MLKRIFSCVFLACFLGGCGFYDKSYKPEVIAERKLLSSRKDQIIKNGKTAIIVIATHLNNVHDEIFSDEREYFFIEIFSELDMPYENYMHFFLDKDSRFLWIREVKSDEFDELFNVSNKWSKAFLVAFEALDEHKKRNMNLSIDVDNLGAMNFDFSYKVFEMQF